MVTSHHQTSHEERVGHVARTLVALAASADGVEAMRTILSGLPDKLQAAVTVVQHRTTAAPNMLASVLQRATKLRVKLAEEGESLLDSIVYIAPPNAHLTVLPDGSVRLLDGQKKIRHVLSSANALFDSAPDAFGANIIAVVLTGSNTDGTDGVQAITEAGGHVLAQEPATARFPRMPESAIATGAVQEVLPLSAIANRVVQLVGECRSAT